jgi:hypothetical protein
MKNTAVNPVVPTSIYFLNLPALYVCGKWILIMYIGDIIICFLPWQKGRVSPQARINRWLLCAPIDRNVPYTFITTWSTFCHALELTMSMSSVQAKTILLILYPPQFLILWFIIHNPFFYLTFTK